MKVFCTTFILALAVFGASVNAQTANDEATQNAIIQALPAGLTSSDATADEVALAARTVVFNMEGDFHKNLTQVMISLGELNRAGVFSQAVNGSRNPEERFYNSMVNMASLKYKGLTTLDIIPISNALIAGINYLNGANLKSE